VECQDSDSIVKLKNLSALAALYYCDVVELVDQPEGDHYVLSGTMNVVLAMKKEQKIYVTKRVKMRGLRVGFRARNQFLSACKFSFCQPSQASR
jgi:hypothetical protein